MKTDKDEAHGFAVWLTEMCSLGTVKLKEAKGNNWEQTKKKRFGTGEFVCDWIYGCGKAFTWRS